MRVKELIIWASAHICFGLSEDHILNGSVCVCGRKPELETANLAWLEMCGPSVKCLDMLGLAVQRAVRATQRCSSYISTIEGIVVLLYTVTIQDCTLLRIVPAGTGCFSSQFIHRKLFQFSLLYKATSKIHIKPRKIYQIFKHHAKKTHTKKTQCITFPLAFEVTCLVNGSLKYIPQEYIHNHPLNWKHNSRPFTRFEINLAKLGAEDFACRHQKSTRKSGLSPDCV